MNRTLSQGEREVSGIQGNKKTQRKMAAPLQTLGVGTKLADAAPFGGPIYRIHEGCIILSRRMHHGPVQLLDVYGPGRIFVHPGAPNSAEVRIECRFEVLLARKHARIIHESLLENLDRSHRHVALLCGKTAVQRVATMLMDLALQFGADPVAQGKLLLPLTRPEIGSWLGLRGETVSRIFTQLIGQQTISADTHRGVHIRDWRALTLIADGSD